MSWRQRKTSAPILPRDQATKKAPEKGKEQSTRFILRSGLGLSAIDFRLYLGVGGRDPAHMSVGTACMLGFVLVDLCLHCVSTHVQTHSIGTSPTTKTAGEESFVVRFVDPKRLLLVDGVLDQCGSSLLQRGELQASAPLDIGLGRHRNDRSR